MQALNVFLTMVLFKILLLCGLWSAIRNIPELKHTKEQRCWVHKIANVLDKLPKRLQAPAKKLLHEMMNAPSEKDLVKPFKEFQEAFHAKYPKAVKCLVNDWDRMIPFFSFPAMHWQHIRTTNPIESTFATIKLRTKVTKGAGSKEMAEAMAFKLMQEAEKRWQCIRGAKEIEYLLSGRVYKDGGLVDSTGDQQGAVA